MAIFNAYYAFWLISFVSFYEVKNLATKGKLQGTLSMYGILLNEWHILRAKYSPEERLQLQNNALSGMNEKGALKCYRFLCVFCSGQFKIEFACVSLINTDMHVSCYTPIRKFLSGTEISFQFLNIPS